LRAAAEEDIWTLEGRGKKQKETTQWGASSFILFAKCLSGGNIKKYGKGRHVTRKRRKKIKTYRVLTRIPVEETSWKF